MTICIQTWTRAFLTEFELNWTYLLKFWANVTFRICMLKCRNVHYCTTNNMRASVCVSPYFISHVNNVLSIAVTIGWNAEPMGGKSDPTKSLLCLCLGFYIFICVRSAEIYLYNLDWSFIQSQRFCILYVSPGPRARPPNLQNKYFLWKQENALWHIKE